MSAYVQERYNPLLVGVNSTATITGESIGGFLCVTSGTITITRNNQAGTVIVNALPVTAGIYLPMPFRLGQHGSFITTAGGASGVLGVG